MCFHSSRLRSHPFIYCVVSNLALSAPFPDMLSRPPPIILYDQTSPDILDMFNVRVAITIAIAYEALFPLVSV